MHTHAHAHTHTHTHTHTHAFAHVHSLSLDRWVGKHDENAVDQDANENEVVEDGAGLNVSADPRMHHINTATPKGLVRTGGTCMLPHCLRSEKKHRFSLVLHSLFLPSSFARFSPFPPLHTHTHIHTHAHIHTHTLSLFSSSLFPFCFLLLPPTDALDAKLANGAGPGENVQGAALPDVCGLWHLERHLDNLCHHTWSKDAGGEKQSSSLPLHACTHTHKCVPRGRLDHSLGTVAMALVLKVCRGGSPVAATAGAETLHATQTLLPFLL